MVAIARHSSASAARSLLGGYVELEGSVVRGRYQPCANCATLELRPTSRWTPARTSKCSSGLGTPRRSPPACAAFPECELGLGSSSTTTVGRRALDAASGGEDVTDARVRGANLPRCTGSAWRRAERRQWRRHRGVHLRGALHYTIPGGAKPVQLQRETVLKAFWSGQSARTSDLRANVCTLQARDCVRYIAVSTRAPSAALLEAACDLGFAPLDIAIDERGVCVCSNGRPRSRLRRLSASRREACNLRRGSSKRATPWR
jgi:hypothetical protein